MLVIFVGGAYLAASGDSGSTSPLVAPAGAVPAAPSPAGSAPATIIQDARAADQSQGAAGQILSSGGLCLAGGTDGDGNGSQVVLATCTGTESQQEWSFLANNEIVMNGRCLGVSPEGMADASFVGLYTCDDAHSREWNVQGGDRIVGAGSGLCLGSWENKDSNGNPVAASACQSTSKAQIWAIPSRAVDPSGLAMPVGSIPGWQQAFTDNFTENVPIGRFPAAVSGKWGDYLDGWPDTTHNGTYEPTQVVSIHGGIMNMFLHTVNGIHMVAAPYPKIAGATGPAGGHVYGIFEVRFKAQPVQGYKTAWLLWPDSNVESEGEIDFPEGDLGLDIRAFMHHVGPDPHVQDAYTTPYTYADWHTATTVWTANSVIFMLDGKVIGHSTDAAVIPHTAMHWVLQTETRTTGGPPSDASAANVEVDWVSVWLSRKS